MGRGHGRGGFEKPLLPEEAGVAKAAGGESMKKALEPRLREYRRRPRRRRHVSFKVTLALSSSKQRRRRYRRRLAGAALVHSICSYKKRSYKKH